MKEKLWEFIGRDGSFISSQADKVATLYFPLANEKLKSSITPTLHGDSKLDQRHFLLEPVSRIDLVNSRASRNFWIYRSPGLIWSATGVSKETNLSAFDRFTMRAGLLWQEVERENKKAGLKASILSFVPCDNIPFEIMRVTLTNISSSSIAFTPTVAIPMFARGAHNIRDHRHVTSLLQRIIPHTYGVVAKPTLDFDERGHRPNTTMYCVLGWDEKSRPPIAVYPTQEIFCGEPGDLETPETVFKNEPDSRVPVQGREPMGALRFKPVTLAPARSISYIIIMGIVDNRRSITQARRSFRSLKQVNAAWEQTKQHWLDISRRIRIDSDSETFNSWFHWVSIQPALRRIYGCSFLPDFDYGKGGRGWRDLWQDCLGLILSDPTSVRQLLVNNFSGVKIDGTNATIIGNEKGEFIADRNDISRVWMDHGLWPLVTLKVYLDETGDFGVLFEKTGYFRDRHLDRCMRLDEAWSAGERTRLLNKDGREHRSTLIEHILIQNLIPFFNVGGHNCIRLEGADWNDGLDMAAQRGESAAFSSFYAYNLLILSELLGKLKVKKIEVAQELSILLRPCKYGSVKAKHNVLREYFQKTQPRISGRTVKLDTARLAKDLRQKSRWLSEHLRRQEWLREGFFNGYYDNRGRRVEGKTPAGVRMMLASQVFPIMSGVADEKQRKRIVAQVNRYLRDNKTGGIRLNTNFKEEQLHLGRAFSFVYGDKENGAYFNHMSIMYAYALYSRGYVREGWRVVRSIYEMAMKTQHSRIYPCLPEYFDGNGRGMYSYLTGSGSWFVLTMVTQVYGVRGDDGNLRIEPKFTGEQFQARKEISISRMFAGRRLEIRFSNQKRRSYPYYKIRRVTINAQPFPLTVASGVLLERPFILALARNKVNTVKVELE